MFHGLNFWKTKNHGKSKINGKHMLALVYKMWVSHKFYDDVDFNTWNIYMVCMRSMSSNLLIAEDIDLKCKNMDINF